MGASELAAEKAIVILKRAIEAAENSNQAGEDFVVAAAAGEALLEELQRLNALVGAVLQSVDEFGDMPDGMVINDLRLAEALAHVAIAKATGAA